MPDFLGFQYRVILDLYRILFHAVVIFGPEHYILLNSASTYCEQFDKLFIEGARVSVAQTFPTIECKLLLNCPSSTKFYLSYFILCNSLPLVVQRYGLSILYF